MNDEENPGAGDRLEKRLGLANKAAALKILEARLRSGQEVRKNEEADEQSGKETREITKG